MGLSRWRWQSQANQTNKNKLKEVINMKKLSALLILAICLSLFVSCAGTPAEANTFKIGLIQLVEHPSLDEIRTAFTEQINAEAEKLGKKVEIDYQNGQNDPTIINTICQKFVGDKVDLIVAIATPAAQGASNAITGTDIPLIFSAVTDPIAAGLMKDTSSPEGNITGTSDAIPVDKIFNLAFEMTPDVKSFGVVYCSSEPNSKIVVEQAKEFLESKGLTLTESAITAVSEVQTAVQSLLTKCDALFIPIDNTVATAMTAVAEEAIAKKVPVYAAADSLVGDGALASVGVNYTELGQKTADMALKALNGTEIKDLPVQYLVNDLVKVNNETANAIGVQVK